MKDIDEHRRTFSKEEINQLPLRRYPGPVFLADSDELLDQALAGLANEDVLGFDTETKPCFRRGQSHPPALLQLAARDRVFIFRLAGLSAPARLAPILSDPGTVKYGVAVSDDIKELNQLFDFDPAGFLDLGETAKSLGIPTLGLRNMAANLLGVRISKSAQCSDWGRKELTQRQISYAATDAWISRELGLRLELLKNGRKKQPRT